MCCRSHSNLWKYYQIPALQQPTNSSNHPKMSGRGNGNNRGRSFYPRRHPYSRYYGRGGANNNVGNGNANGAANPPGNGNGAANPPAAQPAQQPAVPPAPVAPAQAAAPPPVAPVLAAVQPAGDGNAVVLAIQELGAALRERDRAQRNQLKEVLHAVRTGDLENRSANSELRKVVQCLHDTLDHLLAHVFRRDGVPVEPMDVGNQEE